MTIQVKLTPSGRVSLPADVRRRLGIEGGDSLFLDETADGLVLRTAAQAVARARAISDTLLAGASDASVEDFIARRKKWQD